MSKLDKRIWKELKCRADGDRRSISMWRAYLRFLEACPSIPEHTPGTAVHHILWRANYPKFVKSHWNLIRLTHEDHTAAAALALAAEPDNGSLRTGFDATYKMSGSTLRWKPNNPKEIARLYCEKRWTQERIGEKYGVSDVTIGKFLRLNGIPIRTQGESLQWRPKTPAEIIRLYQEKKWDLKRIGTKYGTSHTRVSAFLRRNNVPIRTRGEAIAIWWKNGWAPKNLKEIVCLYEKEKWSLLKLSKRFRIPIWTIRTLLRHSNISIRTNREAQALRWTSLRIAGS